MNDYNQTGTLRELNVQVGDVVEFVEWAFDTTYTRAIGMHYKHCGEKLVSDIGTYFYYADAIKHKWRIVSRASDQAVIDRVLADTHTGPVITETVKRIVPGVYGDVAVHDGYITVETSIDRKALLAAIATLQSIADALDA